MVIARYFYTLASIIMTIFAIICTRNLLNPLLTAFILSLALIPVIKKFEALKMPRLLATLLTILIFILLFLLIIAFFSYELGNVEMNTDAWRVKFDGITGKIQTVLTNLLGIDGEQQTALLKQGYASFVRGGAALLNNTLTLTTSFLSSFILCIIALFFFLYYRDFLGSFMYKLVRPKHHKVLTKIGNKTLSVVNSYIFGLSLIIMATAVMNIAGLALLGIPNAILFGTIAAVLTLIPYIGISVGAILPMVFAFFTKDSLWYPLAIMLLFMLVQFIEGNFLTPNIVGRQISINPFAAILALIAGGLLLGIVGVIFALPVTAIMKVIFDEIPALEPFGYLLGDPRRADVNQV